MKTKTLVMACVLVAGAGSVAFAHPGEHRGGPRQWLEQVDTNKDGKITAAEMNDAASALFAKADTNKDGRVSEAEQTAFREQLRAKFDQKRDEAKGDRFTKRDADKDGRLSAEEVGHMPAGRFARLDGNKDGYLSKAELEAAAKDHMQKRPAHGGGFLKDVDQNHDGAIDRAEMQKETQRRFSQLDKNGDGVVAGDELQPRFAGRGGRHHHGREGGACDHGTAGRDGSR